MKKMFKPMVSAVCTAAILASSAMPVFAEYNYEDKTYAFVTKTYENDLKNENLISLYPSASVSIDITTDEFQKFMKYADRTLNDDNRFSNGDWYVIDIWLAGYDENGNAVVSDCIGGELQGFDAANNPVVVKKPYGEQAIAITYGFDYDVYGGQIVTGFNRVLIRIDENGEPQFVKTKSLDSSRTLWQTQDLHTGENIIVKENPKWIWDDKDTELPYFVLEKGDSTLDGIVDIRDVTQYARHIVKLAEIPSYADMVADLDKNGTIDVKDLASLKSYLIGEKTNL